jgi:hypothetical protein
VQVTSAQPQLTPAPPVALVQPPAQSSKTQGNKAQGSKAQGGGTRGSSAPRVTRGGSPWGSNAQHSQAPSGKASTGGGAPVGGGAPIGSGTPMGSGASISPGRAQGKWGIDCVMNQDLDGDRKSKKCAPQTY